MDNAAPWQTLLREALTLLALPIDEQIRLSGPGCAARDLINDFNHARRLACEEPTLSDDQRQALEAIARVVQGMAEPDVECFNTEALRRPVWQQLRELASDALHVFGWEKVPIEPFEESSPGVWSRPQSGAKPTGASRSAVISRSTPTRADVKEAVKSRVPPWVIVAGCLSVFIFLLLCGTAVGVWVYVLKNGYVFGPTRDRADPSFNAPPVSVNLGPPVGGVAVNGRLVEPQGGFSYVPPEGWMAHQLPGHKYRIVSGPMIGAGAPNINATDELFAGSLEEYVKANLAGLQRFMAEFRVLRQEDFQTSEGLSGVRVITEATLNGRRFRQTYFFFGNGNRKYVVACTTGREGGEELDPIFEASMKTFRLEQQ
ncbi:MAG TPA: hypothetical protein VH592_26115 [Gemmataceae bacterium]